MELGNNNIEQIFKQKFESFQPDVDPKVWNNIQKSIGKSGNSSGSFIGSLAGKLIMGTAAVTIVTVSAIMLMGKGDNTNVNKTIPTIKTPVTVQNLTPVTTKEKSQVTPPTVKNTPVTTNHTVITHQPAPNTITNTNHPADNNPVTNNTVAPVENNIVQNTDDKNNHQETSKPPVYSIPQHPGMNMPADTKKPVTNQTAEEQQNNSNPNDETVNASSNARVAKIEFTTSSSSTYAPLTVYFTNKGKASSEEWNFGDGSFPRYEKSPVYLYEFPGKYTITLTATNDAGKVEKDSIKIEIKSNAFFIPNTFTPNGDGQNDIYKIIKNDNYPYEISNLEIVVYDRTNIKMAAFNSSDYGWDGRSIKDGRMCSQGTYLVVIKYTSSEDGKSHEERGGLFLKN